LARRRFAAVWAALAAVLAGVLSLVVGLAVNAVPKSWGWAHDWWLLVGISASLVAAAVLVAIAQARSATAGEGQTDPVVRVRKPRWSPVAGSNTGTMISAKKIVIGGVRTADPGMSPLASSVKRLGADDNGPGGDTLPPRNPVFTGRNEMLAEVGRRLADGPVAVVAVRGLGGMGKSQVALEYAHRMRASGQYQVAGWVRADSTGTVSEDLAAMAPLLGMPEDGPAGEVAASVVAALGSRRKWLLVFDNAQAPHDLAGMLPSGSGHVLITSRNREWSGVAGQLDLGEFSRAESVAFLCKRSGRVEPEAAGELAGELGDLPLALAQAAAYIDARAATISGYLALYRDPVLARRLRDEGMESGEYPASVARTWLLAFGQLASDRPAAVELLRLCAFLDPDDIDLDILTACAAEAGAVMAATLRDRLERAETVGALARASLVTVPTEGRLRVHRLVQAVTRDQLDDDQAAAWARRALSLVAAVFPDEPEDQHFWPVCANLSPHVEAVAAHTECYPDLAGKRGRLLGRLGIYLSASAEFRVGSNVLSILKAATEAAATDPESGVSALQEVLDTAAGRTDYRIARAASRSITRTLRRTGRIREALRTADLMIAFGHRADIGLWTQLSDKSERLQIRVEAGLDNQSILAEAVGLIAEAEHLPKGSARPEKIDPDWVHESLLRSAANAAAGLHQWSDVLRFIQAEVTSLHDRGAPPVEVADAEFNSYSALVQMQRIPEAKALLDRCETAFRQEHGSQHRYLGLVAAARADLAAIDGQPALAVGLQSEALDWFYQSGDIFQIQRGHSNFGRWLEETDRFSAQALAHEIVAGVLAVMLGQAADIPTITRRMMFRAGEYPATLAQLSAVVEETPGVHLRELLQQLTRNMAISPSEILSKLLRQARKAQSTLFDEIARHRMEWDPVFAGIVAAKQGDAIAARVVSMRLSIYATDESWSQFSRALGYILHQRPVAAASMSLDAIDQIFIRRCKDALDGSVHIQPELVQAIPIAGELSRFLGAAQNNEPDSILTQALEMLAEHEQWRQLPDPLRRILAGDRDPGITTGLTHGNAVIISELLGYLVTP
jgi:hypothetical protein